MNETGLGRDSFWPLTDNYCADEHRSEDELQTTEGEMCVFGAVRRTAGYRSSCWVGTQQRERMVVDPVNQYQKL